MRSNTVETVEGKTPYHRWRGHRRRRSLTFCRNGTPTFLVLAIAWWMGVPDGTRAQEPWVHALERELTEAFLPDRPGGVVAVARNGEIAYQRAFGLADVELRVPVRPDHVFLIGSVTKQFTAVAVLQLVQQGLIRLSDDVRDYVPDFDTGGSIVTIEEVLTHTGGLPNVVDRPDFESFSRLDHSVRELLNATRGRPLHFPPGEGFRYSDTGYFLLGAIVERLSGMSYQDYVETRIFRPLGMDRSWYGGDGRIIPGRVRGYTYEDGVLANAPHISMSVPYAAGGLASTAGDLLNWYDALNGGRVLDPELLARAWTGRMLPDGTHSGYGFGWKVCTLGGHRSVEHGGFVNGFGASVTHLPELRLTVVVLVNQDAGLPDAGDLARRIARLITTGQEDPPYVRLEPWQRAALVGRYRIADGDEREILEDDEGRLFSKRGGGEPLALTALSATELTLTSSEGALVFAFRLDPSGRTATGVTTFLRCEPTSVGHRIGS